MTVPGDSPLGYPINTQPSIRRIVRNRAPTANDNSNFREGDEWLNSASNDWYKLANNTGSVATWVLIGGTAGAVESFIPDTGTSPVVPNASNQITVAGGNGIQTTGGTNTITYAMNSPFTGDFVFTSSTAGDTESVTISNTDNTAANASSAAVIASVGGTTQIGDPYFQMSVGSTRSYSIGPDTSDSQILKINTDTAASVTPSSGTNLFLMTSSSSVAFTTLSIGHATPEIDSSFTINGAAISSVLSIDTEGATDLGGIIDHRHSNTAALGGHLIGLRSRGTHSTPAAVQSGDVLFRILSAGYDGTDYAQSAEIRSEVDNTPGANDMPGRIVFLTSPDGSQTPTESLRLDSSQNAIFTKNISTTGGSVTIDPGASGDSFLQYNINTTGEFRVGVDDDDGDSYKISQGSALGTNDTFIMTAAGERTLPLQPAFMAWIGTTTGGVTGAGTNYQLQSFTEAFDQNSDFNASTGVFTAPVTGRYFFHSAVRLQALTAAMTAGNLLITPSTTNRNFSVEYVNIGAIRDASNQASIEGSCMIDLAASDTVVFTIQVSGGAGDTAVVAGDATNQVSYVQGWLVC